MAIGNGLSEANVAEYREKGFLSPIKVFSREEVSFFQNELEKFESTNGFVMKTAFRNKPHLVFKWVSDVIRNPKILDIAASVLGPNLLVWGTNFFIKEPGDGSFISWHQDSTYWGLSRPDVLTIWLAITPSLKSTGAMKMVKGSHKLDQLPHTDTFVEGNLLTRGQEVDHVVEEKDVECIELAPGNVSLHHVRIVHGSEPNEGQDRRIGLAIRLIPTDVSQVNGMKDHATLVRGIDEYRYFEHEPIPLVDMGTEEVEAHKRIAEESFNLLYKGTDRGPDLG